MPWKYIPALVGLTALAGCDNLPGKPNPAERPVRPDQVTEFKPLFKSHCSGCHGAAGKLGPAPPLNDPLFLAIAPDDELRKVMSKGRANTLMPAFDSKHPGGTLTAAQIEALIEGMRAAWGQAKPTFSVPIPAYAAVKGAKAGEATAGREAFMTACAQCHGNEGQGTESAGAINQPAFLALMSDQALRRTIITGRHDLGMPNFAEPAGRPGDFKPLTNQNVDDLMALLQAWRAKK